MKISIFRAKSILLRPPGLVAAGMHTFHCNGCFRELSARSSVLTEWYGAQMLMDIDAN